MSTPVHTERSIQGRRGRYASYWQTNQNSMQAKASRDRKLKAKMEHNRKKHQGDQGAMEKWARRGFAT